MCSKILSPSSISELASGSEKALIKFDSHGLPPAPGEDFPEYAQRMSRLAGALDELEKELSGKKTFEVAPGIKIAGNARLPQKIYSEALTITEKLYKVSPDWVPGFFANESFGAMWGGCALSDPQSNLVLFIIRKVFSGKKRWLFYRREELMAHELIHAAHQALNEIQFEEYFAYRSAFSPLRKFFGGCFIYKFDAMLFLLPIMLLPAAQACYIFRLIDLPMWIFWMIAAIYPLFLTIRCTYNNLIVARARKFLQQNNIADPDAVLFRMTSEEISLLAGKIMPQGSDLRWRIIRRFMKKN